MQILRAGRNNFKTRIEPQDETWKERVAGGNRVDPSQRKFLDEAVLQRPMDPLWVAGERVVTQIAKPAPFPGPLHLAVQIPR